MKKGRFSRSWRKLLRRRDGTSAIELALILPVIAAMIVPLADLGMAAFTKMEVQNAAQAGADYALKNASGTFNATNIGTAVTSATALIAVVMSCRRCIVVISLSPCSFYVRRTICGT